MLDVNTWCLVIIIIIIIHICFRWSRKRQLPSLNCQLITHSALSPPSFSLVYLLTAFPLVTGVSQRGWLKVCSRYFLASVFSDTITNTTAAVAVAVTEYWCSFHRFSNNLSVEVPSPYLFTIAESLKAEQVKLWSISTRTKLIHFDNRDGAIRRGGRKAQRRVKQWEEDQQSITPRDGT